MSRNPNPVLGVVVSEIALMWGCVWGVPRTVWGTDAVGVVRRYVTMGGGPSGTWVSTRYL